MRKLLVLSVAVCALLHNDVLQTRRNSATRKRGRLQLRARRESKPYGRSSESSAVPRLYERARRSGTGRPTGTATATAPCTGNAGSWSGCCLALPPGFALKAVDDNLKNAGAALYAVNRTLDIGMAVMPVPHEGVTDLTAFASTKKAAQVDRLKDGTSSEVARLEVGGRNAVRYSVTGTLKNLKITF